MKKMKFEKQPLKISAAVIAALMSSFAAAATECAAEHGCKIYANGTDKTVVVPVGNYSYKVPTVAEFNELLSWVPNTSIGDNIFSFSNYRYNDGTINNNNRMDVTIESGAKIVVDGNFLGNEVYGDRRGDLHLGGISVSGSEKLTTLTLKKGSEIVLQNYPVELSEGMGLAAVRSSNGTIDSQADIHINAPYSVGYSIQPGQLYVHNSKIVMSENSEQSFAAAVGLSGSIYLDTLSAKAFFSNVEITGAARLNVGVSIFDSGTVDFNNSSLRLTGPDSIGFYIAGGDLNIENSTVDADYGIALQSDEWAKKGYNNVKVTNSSLVGRTALLGANDSRVWGYGDADEMATDASDWPFVLKADNSYLAGRVYKDLVPSQSITFNLNNGTTWSVNGDSELDALNISDSSVAFVRDGTYKTLTVTGDLGGTGGLFYLNTDLAHQQSDKLVVEGQVSGSHRISVADSRNEPVSANGKVTLVESGGGSGTFSMVQSYVDAGRYRYYFYQDGSNWVLGNDGSSSGVPEISDYGNSLVGMRQAAVQLVYDLQQPLDNKINKLYQTKTGNGLWIDGGYTRNRYDGTSAGYGLKTSGFKQKTNMLQIGYDHQFLPDEGSQKLYLGAFAGRGQSDIDFSGNYRNGNLKAVTVGIYGGWYNDSNWFAGLSYRYTHLKSTAYKVDDAKWHANSLTAEGGKGFAFGNWTVTPSLALTVGRLSGDRFATGTGFYRSKAGVSAGYTVNAAGAIFTPYAGIYWLHDKNKLGRTVVNDSSTFGITGAGNSGLYEAGVGIASGRHSLMNVALRYAKGSKTEQNLGAQAQYRYSW